MWNHRGSLCLCAAGLLAACEPPHPALYGLIPTQGLPNQDIAFTITGDNLIPATLLDPNSGRRIPTSDGFQVRIGGRALSNVTWLSVSQMSGWLTAADTTQLPVATSLDLDLTDPRGQSASLVGAYTQQGPDQQPPVVGIDGLVPDAASLVPGLTLRGQIHATAAVGPLAALTWTYRSRLDQTAGNCDVPPGASQTVCAFQVQINANLVEGDIFSIDAVAVDAQGNQGEDEIEPTLHASPVLNGIDPAIGGSTGGTEVVITGQGFPPGSKVTIGGALLFPDGGVQVDAQTLTGRTPAHPQGTADVQVQTTLGPARPAKTTVYFTYAPAPQVTDVEPASGSAAGGSPVAVTGKNFTDQTHIYFGATLANAAPLQAPTRSGNTISGTTPPGPVGATTVWAVDDALGLGQLAGGFTWSSP